MYRNDSILKRLDWWTLCAFIVLVIFGWVNIYSASYNFEQTSILSLNMVAGKQLLWIGIALLLGFVLLLVDAKMYSTLAYIVYAIWLIVLLITPFLARDIKGSLSWISIGPFSLQPAEFAKCFTALALAKYMSQYDYRVRNFRDLIVPCLILGVPMLIIMILQRETGSALVFLSFCLMLYRQGMSGYILLIGTAAIVFFIIAIRFSIVPLPLGTGSWGMLTCMLLILCTILLFLLQQRNKRDAYIYIGGVVGLFTIASVVSIWYPLNFDWVSTGIVVASIIYLAVLAFIHWSKDLLLILTFAVLSACYCHACDFVFNRILQPHQRVRMEVFLNMKDDPSGAGYNVNQSLIAIGSGGFAGKGFLQGTQTKMKFVPEQNTDFIFCTIGEEWGFLGSVGVLLVYLFLILRILHLAERQKDRFSQIYAYCVAGIFLFHLVINVGMVLGFLPVIGIPLPFLSYGGSSMIGFTLLLFILLRLDAERVEMM